MSELELTRQSNIARNNQELISLGFLNPSGESMMTKGNKKRTRESTKPPVHSMEATRRSNRIEANSHCPSSPELKDDRFSVDEWNRLTCNSCNIVFKSNSSNHQYSWRSHQKTSVLACPHMRAEFIALDILFKIWDSVHASPTWESVHESPYMRAQHESPYMRVVHASPTWESIHESRTCEPNMRVRTWESVHASPTWDPKYF